MPGMDGLEFLRQAQGLAPAAPRVLVTAFPDLQLAVNAVNESRIQRFVTKPWDSDEMVATVHRLLASGQAEEQKRQQFARSLEALRQRLR
jgi:response regulator RpfG family c-di-GMP phosphodiesterase